MKFIFSRHSATVAFAVHGISTKEIATVNQFSLDKPPARLHRKENDKMDDRGSFCAVISAATFRLTTRYADNSGRVCVRTGGSKFPFCHATAVWVKRGVAPNKFFNDNGSFNSRDLE